MQFRNKKIDYTSPASAQGGPGIAAQFPWYQGTPYLNMTAAQLADSGLSLGDTWWLGGKAPASGGNCFQVVKADATLALGQVVTLAAPTAGTFTALGSTSAAIVTSIATNGANSGLNAEVDNYITVNPAGGSTVWNTRRIKANDSSATATFTVALPDRLRPNSPTDQDVFDGFASFANADAVCVTRPYHVIVNTATTVPCGIALAVVTQYNYTIIQIAGYAGVKSTTSTANVPAVGAAAGVIVTGAGTANAYMAAGQILPMQTNAVANNIVSCMVNFTGQ